LVARHLVAVISGHLSSIIDGVEENPIVVVKPGINVFDAFQELFEEGLEVGAVAFKVVILTFLLLKLPSQVRDLNEGIADVKLDAIRGQSSKLSCIHVDAGDQCAALLFPVEGVVQRNR